MPSARYPIPLLAWLALCAFAAGPSVACAQKLDATIAIGQSGTVWSEVLQEERRYLVYLPPHYAKSGKAYPVLYLLDAEMQFHSATGIVQFLSSVNDRIPEMIVVGVTNADRTRDLTPPISHPQWAKEHHESGGGAAAFLRFFSEELIPSVDVRYRTQPYRVLVGHSFGGLFSLYAMSTRPELFQAHIAISPSLWWDQEAPIAAVSAGIRRAAKAPWLFISWGDNEANIRDTNQKLVAALTENPPPALRWEHRYYPGEDHMSTPHRSLYDALQLLFSDWRMPRMVADVEQHFDMRAVESHYSALTARFGFPVTPSPAALAVAADSLLAADSAGALAIMRRATFEYPYLAAPHWQLGEALERLGRTTEALLEYERALLVAIDDEYPYRNPIDEYRAKVKELARNRK